RRGKGSRRGGGCASAAARAARLVQASISMPSAVMRYSTGSTATPLALSAPRCSTCAGVSCLRVSTPCTTAVPLVFFGIWKSWSPNITRAALPLSSSIIQQPLAWQTSVMRPLNRCARSAWASKAPIASDTGTVAPPGTGLPYGVGVDAPAAAADSSRSRVGSRRMARSFGRVGHDSAKPAALALACGSACCWNANVSDWSHLIRDVPDFPKPGITFRDITPVLADARAFAAAVAAMAAPWRSAPPDVVAGIESRGFILGAALALELGCGFVPVRKPGKLPGRTLSEGYRLEYGSDRVGHCVDPVPPGAQVLVVDVA